MPSQNSISPAAVLLVIRMHARRRPLWKLGSVADFCDMETAQVTAKIEDGTFPWAFNLGTNRRRSEPRVLAVSVLELKLGPLPDIGASRNLGLPEVLKLVLPARDLRSTELKRLFSCSSEHVHNLKRYFRITRKPKAKDGPHSFTVFSRASVAAFLAQRRIL